MDLFSNIIGFARRALSWGGGSLLAGLFVVIITSITAVPVQAAQTTPYKVNFQGRVVDASGNPKPDGLYNIKFRLFAASSGGVASWTETRETTDRVQVTNGLFNVQLGDVTALSPSNFTSYPLYLEVELPTPATATCSTAACASWAEGAMTPRSPIGSSPYALNADTIDGIDGANLAQLSANNTFTGTALFKNASNSTSAFAIQTSGGANLLVADTTNLALKVGGGDVSTDASPALLVVDHKSTSGDPTGTNGAIYYNASSKKFRCYEDGAWKDCIANLNARTSYYYANDMMGNYNFPTGVVTNFPDGQMAHFGSGTGATGTSPASETSRAGLSRSSTGTTTTGYSGLISSLYNNAGSPSAPIFFGSGSWVYATALRVSALSDGTQTYNLASGLSENAGFANGCYIRYTHSANSGKWSGNCATGGTVSTCDLGVTVAASTWYNLKIAVNAAATEAVFVVDDTNTCSVTSNIPTAAVGWVSWIQKSAGSTARTLDHDFVEVMGNGIPR